MTSLKDVSSAMEAQIELRCLKLIKKERQRAPAESQPQQQNSMNDQSNFDFQTVLQLKADRKDFDHLFEIKCNKIDLENALDIQ